MEQGAQRHQLCSEGASKLGGIHETRNCLSPSLVFLPSLPIWFLTCPLVLGFSFKIKIAAGWEASGSRSHGKGMAEVVQQCSTFTSPAFAAPIIELLKEPGWTKLGFYC